MRVDGNLESVPHAGRLATAARAGEAAGYAGLWVTETAHDPFLPLAIAAEHTARVELGTGIAVAFARNPMLLANLGWDLQAMSAGRLVLGLGSQIRPHITKRFSMPWSQPAPRMREMVQALRAIWHAWLTEGSLRFRGDFYTHTLMTPHFRPDPADVAPYGPPKVFLAGVGPQMTRVAGEVCDGFLCHPFTTERYLREVTIPALAAGRAVAGATLEGFEISGPSFVATGWTGEEMAMAVDATRQRIAFYGSTPAYRAVLDLHGWGALHEELHSLSRRGRWGEMGLLIDDEVLGTFAVVAEPDEVAPELLRRYGDVAQRLQLTAPGHDDPARWTDIIASLGAV